jgi:ribonuclease VapC
VIAIDTSAIIAVIFDQAEAQDFSQALATTPSVVAAATLLECHQVLASRESPEFARYTMQEFLTANAVTIAAFGEAHWDLARDAFDRFGRGRGHRARLNFGDCLSYAVAKALDLPLLFKGDDFRHTDSRAVL